MSGLFSARLRFTRFTGRDDGAIVWLTTRLITTGCVACACFSFTRASAAAMAS
ncbi:hypothetical protein SEEC0006_27468 [Salmonella enterica subsp. enterica serovar Choleraesuis str. 0006]|nr:hypothetical protein SEEC0006_27468 [Salmonella enterica subsp. enterica serovar Choleraesuis str. 0006]